MTTKSRVRNLRRWNFAQALIIRAFPEVEAGAIGAFWAWFVETYRRAPRYADVRSAIHR